jgi:hypothetical protein
MSSHFRWQLGRYRGIVNCDLTWDIINPDSIVIVTASECGPDDVSVGGRVGDRFMGEARYTVNNISPYFGGVNFRITIEWAEPLFSYVTVSVLD